jgi:hypothetical protein
MALRFKKMYGVCWDKAPGQVLCAPDGAGHVELGTVRRVLFTNFGGPFRAVVTFADDTQREFALGQDSPLLALKASPAEVLGAGE